MNSWAAAWLGLSLLALLALGIVVAGLLKSGRDVISTARRFGEETGPLREHISREGQRVSRRTQMADRRRG